MLLPEHEQVFAYVRTLGDEHLLVAVNCSSEPAPLDLGDDARLLGGDVHLGSLPTDAALPPWHHLVVSSS